MDFKKKIVVIFVILVMLAFSCMTATFAVSPSYVWSGGNNRTFGDC